MHPSPDRLYELLPLIHRQRDAEQGYPLRALLQVIGEQVDVVEEDIEQLYENWFIETAQDWVVPYIGDLVGYRPVHAAGQPGSTDTAQGRLRNKFLIPRREVANTIRYRRSKGTLALLELLANDVAGWPGRAVEFYRLLSYAQALNHLRLRRGQTTDLRWGEALDRLDGPFEELAHTVDVRRINSARTPGRYNIPSVGIFVWRLKAFPVERSQACCHEEIGPNCFAFSVLCNDTPLYTNPEPEPEPTHIAGEMNLPVPIRRRAFETRKGDYYGEGKSLMVWTGVQRGPAVEVQPVPVERIIPADLSGWQYRPRRGYVALDPVLGRLVFPPGQLPKGVWVSYRYGFSAEMGGGVYSRRLSQPAVQDEPVTYYRVGEHEELDSLERALDRWMHADPRPKHAVIDIIDNGVYSEQPIIVMNEGESLQIRAADGKRPIIYLGDRRKNRPDSFTVTSESGGCLTLDGLLITGRAVHIEGALQEVRIRHCTLVPGWELDSHCEPRRPTEPSLELYRTQAHVYIEHSIVGSIQVYQDEVQADPAHLFVADSIVDATANDLEALGGVDWSIAHVIADIRRSTIIGEVITHAISLGENSIFTGRVRVARSQMGCMRFCYIPPGSRTPRRYNCQSDLAEQAVVADLRQFAAENSLPAPGTAELTAAREGERSRLQPVFNSTRYGTPAYCQLSLNCALEIRTGADDEAEMGAFHDLFQPQREANLRARLEEYTPAGMDAGIIFAS